MNFTQSFKMPGLSTPVTIFRTTSAFSIDDGAKVKHLTGLMNSDFVGGFDQMRNRRISYLLKIFSCWNFLLQGALFHLI